MPIPHDGPSAAELLARVASSAASGELDKGIAAAVTQATKAYITSGIPAEALAEKVRAATAQILVHREAFSCMTERDFVTHFGRQWTQVGGEGPPPRPGQWDRCRCKQACLSIIEKEREAAEAA